MSKQLDKLMQDWSDEVRNRYRIHLIEPAMKPRITFAEEVMPTAPAEKITGRSATEASLKTSGLALSKWARAWLKVAKGIIG